MLSRLCGYGRLLSKPSWQRGGEHAFPLLEKLFMILLQAKQVGAAGNPQLQLSAVEMASLRYFIWRVVKASQLLR